jgi:hypothetical protein
MRKGLTSFILLILIIFTSGCSGTASGIDTAIAPTQLPGGPAKVSSSTGTYFAINEIGLGVNGYVSLTNFTDVAASMEGLYLCQGS